MLRIVGNARYPNSLGTPFAVAEIMTALRSLPGHEFWPDDVSLLDGHCVDVTHLSDSTQVTDTYLLALARAHGGRLATFDRHLVASAVVDGSQTLVTLE